MPSFSIPAADAPYPPGPAVARECPENILRQALMGSISSRTLRLAETIVPDSGGPDERAVRAEAGGRQFGFLGRHESATAFNHLADTLGEQVRTPHDSSSEDDRFRREHRYQVGQADAEVTGFALDRT